MKHESIKLLRQERKRRKWTQQRLADYISVPVRTLRAWEQGTRTPKPIVIRAIERLITNMN